MARKVDNVFESVTLGPALSGPFFGLRELADQEVGETDDLCCTGSACRYSAMSGLVAEGGKEPIINFPPAFTFGLRIGKYQ